jgi:hypothetical protein
MFVMVTCAFRLVLSRSAPTARTRHLRLRQSLDQGTVYINKLSQCCCKPNFFAVQRAFVCAMAICCRCTHSVAGHLLAEYAAIGTSMQAFAIVSAKLRCLRWWHAVIDLLLLSP